MNWPRCCQPIFAATSDIIVMLHGPDCRAPLFRRRTVVVDRRPKVAA
jgi:hypothetical protein